MARAKSSTATAPSTATLDFEMLAPYKGRIYDPACGSGGRFVQSELPSEATVCQFVESHGGKLIFISVLGKMNRANSTANLLN